jgi:hypothetical protein
MLTMEYSRTLKKIPLLDIFSLNLVFLKISTFLKDDYNWCQNCQVPCHFLGANFCHLVTKNWYCNFHKVFVLGKKGL